MRQEACTTKFTKIKPANGAVDFLSQCKEFYPFYISHILTDNGFEFTDRFAKGRKTPGGNHKFDKACQKEGIEHRLTAPATPSKPMEW